MNIIKTLFILSLCTTSLAVKEVAPEILKNNKTNIKNPLELRDPFKRELRKKRRGKKDYPGTKSVFSNVPSIDATPLDRIKITGILIGKERRAVAKIIQDERGGLSEESYILKEGMKLGENNAEIKAILPGGIVLVEKIRNVYDQDEYLETIIPVAAD
jgi:type IV pilus assembly protein PilP